MAKAECCVPCHTSYSDSALHPSILNVQNTFDTLENTFVSKKNYKTVHSSVFQNINHLFSVVSDIATWHLALNVFLSVLGASCQHSTWHLVFHKVQRARWEVLCHQLSLSTWQNSKVEVFDSWDFVFWDISFFEMVFRLCDFSLMKGIFTNKIFQMGQKCTFNIKGTNEKHV